MATEAQLKSWLAGYPRNWNGLCQALMWQAADKFGSPATPALYGSANIAYRASRIASTNPHSAPAGAIHYWNIGRFGHVALSLGGARVLMGSSHVQESWGTNVGVTTVDAYNKATGAGYLGWSRTNGANTIPVAVPVAAVAVASVSTAGWRYTSPSLEVGKRVQRALKGKGRLPANYVVDGIDGPDQRKAVQKTLNFSKVFAGLEDGKIEGGGCLGIQVYAEKYGDYDGPKDSRPMDNSWNNFALGLERP